MEVRILDIRTLAKSTTQKAKTTTVEIAGKTSFLFTPQAPLDRGAFFLLIYQYDN